MTGPTRVSVRSTSGFAYGAITLYRRPSQAVLLPSVFVTSWAYCITPTEPTTPTAQRCTLTCNRFRLIPLRSPLLRESSFLSFPGDTEMFQFPPFPPHTYVFSMRSPGITPAEFPHSEIFGSKPAWRLPEAYRSHTTSFIGL